jgi:malyl-CoA/(S)-citramalyl-CoA lyase
MRNPRDFFKPLAIGAPEPLREIPVLPSRMIHFLDFSNEKMVAKVPDIAPTVDILLATSRTPCRSIARRPRGPA